MRTKDELFRAAQREVAARRQRAVTRAEALRAEALRRHPEIGKAEAERTRLGAAVPDDRRPGRGHHQAAGGTARL